MWRCDKKELGSQNCAIKMVFVNAKKRSYNKITLKS